VGRRDPANRGRAERQQRRVGWGSARRGVRGSASAISRRTCMGPNPGIASRPCLSPSPGGEKPRPGHARPGGPADDGVTQVVTTTRGCNRGASDIHLAHSHSGAPAGRAGGGFVGPVASRAAAAGRNGGPAPLFGLRKKRQAEHARATRQARHRPSHGTTPERDGTARIGWLI
jgi:hypothetical protein